VAAPEVMEGNASIEVVFEDRASNDGVVVRSVTDGSVVTIDLTPPTLPLVSIISDNANDTARASATDTITLSITADEPITMPVVHIAGNVGAATGVGQVYAGPSYTQYTVVYTVAAPEVMEGNASIEVVFEDRASNDGVVVRSVTDGSVVTIDLTPPTLTAVSIVSDNNADTARANDGDTITLLITSSEPVMVPTVFILGQPAVLIGTGNRVTHSGGTSFQDYNATYTVVGAAVLEGITSLLIIYQDLASNVGRRVQNVTDSSAVEVDLTPPTLLTVSLTSDSKSDAFRATVGEVITLDWVLSEPTVHHPRVSFNGTSATVVDLTANGAGLVYRSTYNVTTTDHSAFWMNFIIDGFVDAASNPGVAVTSTTDSSGIFVDLAAPVFLNCAELNIVGGTDTGENFGTEEQGSLRLRYPLVQDNAPSEPLVVTALVDGVAIDNSTDGRPSTYRFPYRGEGHDVRTNVTFSVTDRAGLSTQCLITAIIVDDEPPKLNCSGRDVDGWTVDGVHYGTEVNNTLALRYPSVWDNSGETLTATAKVGSNEINVTHRFPYTGLTEKGWTIVTYSTTDSSGLTSYCDVSVTVADNEKPVLEDGNNCSLLNVVGVTDKGKPYSTTATDNLVLKYPVISDNSGENITAIPYVDGVRIGDTYPFPYVGVGGDVATELMYRAWDQTGNTQNCSVRVTIVDNQPPVLQDCAMLNTEQYRQALGSSDLVYPQVTDNSGETLKVFAFVGPFNITDIRPPRELGAATSDDGSVVLRVNSDGSLDVVATVIFNASDSTGLVSTCQTQTVLDIVDDCENHPCHHSARCINKPVHGYRCICAPGYTSTNCDVLARAVTFGMVGGIAGPFQLQATVASHLAQNMPGSFDATAVDQLVPTRFVQICYAFITVPGDRALFGTAPTQSLFREAIASVFGVDADLVTFHNATAAGVVGGIPHVAIEYSVHSDDDMRPVVGSPAALARAFESAVVFLHAADHTGAWALPYLPASFNRTRCKETLPHDAVWCGFNATAVAAQQVQVFTELGLIVLANATAVEAAVAGMTLAAFEQTLFAQLTRTTALVSALAKSAPGSTVTSMTSKVLQIGECHQGLEIDQSSRTLRTPCAGRVGQTCRYECKYGYNAFGSHVCGADGVFAGGMCAPLGQVPLSCNGNVRVIPSSTISSIKLAESSGSQQRAFMQQEELCHALPQHSGCGAGGCAPLKPNE
jgi:hypothetical protein